MKPSTPANAGMNKWGKPAVAQQTSLLPEAPALAPAKQAIPAEETAKVDERKTLLNRLETMPDLWDLRYWRSNHDMTEIMAYVVSPEISPKPSNVDFAVERLKELGVTHEAIAMAIDHNKGITFKHRLGPCGLDFECEPHKKAGNYADCHCDLRCEKGLSGEKLEEALGKRNELETARSELHRITPEAFAGMKKANELLRVSNEALARENIELKRKLGLAP